MEKPPKGDKEGRGGLLHPNQRKRVMMTTTKSWKGKGQSTPEEQGREGGMHNT